MTATPFVPVRPAGIVAASTVVAALGFVVAGYAEVGLIRMFRPSAPQLVRVSDAVLSCGLGVAVYLWLHLRAMRRALLDRERVELVLNTQLSIAAELQRRLLPAMPEGDRRVEWAATLRPAGHIGGDFYDLVSFEDGRVMCLVADVSGKGIPAAMALPTLRAAFRALALPRHGPAEVLSQLSATLLEQWGGTQYCTAVVALVDVDAGTLRYANAGHPAGLIVGPSGTRRLDPLGPPVALLEGASYGERELRLEPGDRCVLVSDGVTEALGSAIGDVEHFIHDAEVAPGSTTELCGAVMAAAVAGTGPEGIPDWDDDRTVLVISVLEPASAVGHGAFADRVAS